MSWDTEPAATQRREQKVLIANAKVETAERLGWVIAIAAAFTAHTQLQSWLVTLLVSAVTYWIVTAPYKRDLDKAKDEYVAHAGKTVDFI